MRLLHKADSKENERKKMKEGLISTDITGR